MAILRMSIMKLSERRRTFIFALLFLIHYRLGQVEATDCRRPVVPHSNSTSPTPPIHHGEFFTVTCDSGYSDGKSQSQRSQCKYGHLRPAILNCYADCVQRRIPYSDHSQQQPDILNGQTTTINCWENFSMGPETQSITLTCYDGELNDETVKCYANCKLVQTPINGNITKGSPPFFHNKEVVFGCCPEYTLIGDKKIICSNGSWNGYPPVCTERESQLSTTHIVVIAIAVPLVIVIAVVLVICIARNKKICRSSKTPNPNEKTRLTANTDGGGYVKTWFLSCFSRCRDDSTGTTPQTNPPCNAPPGINSLEMDNLPTNGTSSESSPVSPELNSDGPVDDEKLEMLAKHVPHGDYTMFCSKLGIPYNEARSILVKFKEDYRGATRECLAKWKNGTGGMLSDLKKILIEIKLTDLIRRVE